MKFPAERWADAYLSSAGSDSEAGLVLLKCFTEASRGVHKHISGRMKADEIIRFLDHALIACKADKKTPGVLAAQAILYLLIARGYFPFLSMFITAIEHARNLRDGVLEAVVESAADTGEDFLEKLRDSLKEKSGAREVKLLVTVKPELLGGFRLIIGSDRQDFSLKGYLKQLETTLVKDRKK